MRFNHKGVITWDIPYQKMRILTTQGLSIPFKDGIPGEKIKLNLKKTGKRQYQISDYKISYFSKDRIPVSCIHFHQCGGCEWLHVSYKKTIEWKRAFVEELLRKHSVSYPHLIEIRHLDSPFQTRWKATYPIQKINNQIRIGLFRPGTHDVLSIEECWMVPKEFNEIRQKLKNWIESENIPVYDEQTREGWLRYLLIQKGFSSGNILITLITTAHNPQKVKQFETYLAEDGIKLKVIGLNEMINTSTGNAIFSHDVHSVSGQSYLEEFYENKTIRITSDTFFQANPPLALEMFQQILSEDIRYFIELFAGIGIIGLIHSGHYEKGIGFESNPSSVTWGNTLFNNNQIPFYQLQEMDLYQTPADELIRILSEESISPEESVIVADPPRRGLGKNVLKFLTQFLPYRLIYISCNPRKFAKEAKTLLDSGYRLELLQGYDLFPFTSHLEIVGHFTKSSGRNHL